VFYCDVSRVLYTKKEPEIRDTKTLTRREALFR